MGSKTLESLKREIELAESYEDLEDIVSETYTDNQEGYVENEYYEEVVRLCAKKAKEANFSSEE